MPAASISATFTNRTSPVRLLTDSTSRDLHLLPGPLIRLRAERGNEASADRHVGDKGVAVPKGDHREIGRLRGERIADWFQLHGLDDADVFAAEGCNRVVR